MLKESSLVGIAVVMDMVLKTVSSQETSPILKRGKDCGRVQEILNLVVGMEKETMTIDKMVVEMEEEEVAKIEMALITRILVPAVLTGKSLQNKEKTTRKISMVQLGIGVDAVAAGQRHMGPLNIGTSQTQRTISILNHLHQLLVPQCKSQQQT